MFVKLLMLYGFLAIMGYIIVVYLLSRLSRRSQRKELEQKLRTELDEHSLKEWQSSERIQYLLSMYMNMCIKHGVNSEEAQAFRFGIDNKEFAQLYGQEALNAFNMIADCFKSNYERWSSKEA